jgi:ABC-type glycerol-3-phosphate transport system substrate-binding protein
MIVSDMEPLGSPSSAKNLSAKDLVHSLVVAGAVVAGALSTGWPERPIQWVLLIIAAVLGGLAPHTRWIGSIRSRGFKVLRRLRPPRLRPLLLSALALVVAATAGRLLVAATEPGVLVILSGADNGFGDQRQVLIDLWNAVPGRPHARIVSVRGGADAEHAEMLATARAGGRDVDVYNLDITLMAAFVDSGYLRAVDPTRLDLNGFIANPLGTCRRNGKLWGLPFNTDAAMLYYRSDVLDRLPVLTSWVQLNAATEAVFASQDESHRELVAGYTGQLAGYEGLTVNALEAIWAAGGDVVDAQGKVIIDTPAAREGLRRLATGLRMHSPQLILPEALSHTEADSLKAFRDGKVIFMRNWPAAYFALAGPPGTAKPFGVTRLPGPSVLGGQNLAIAAHSDQPRAAQELIEFLTSDRSQQILFERGGFAPTREIVFNDAEVRTRYPYADTLYTAITTARLRPQTPRYASFSEVFRTGVLYALQHDGEMPEGFAAELTAALRVGGP